MRAPLGPWGVTAPGKRRPRGRSRQRRLTQQRRMQALRRRTVCDLCRIQSFRRVLYWSRWPGPSVRACSSCLEDGWLARELRGLCSSHRRPPTPRCPNWIHGGASLEVARWTSFGVA